MGIQFSKKKTQELALAQQLNTADLRSYEDDCKLNPDLQSFNSSLKACYDRAINSLAEGVEVRALSVDSLKAVTGSLLEMNEEVVKIILDCKEDIWKNKELLELVFDYFKNSEQTLDFCNGLNKCKEKAKERQLIIKSAIREYEKEDGENGTNLIRTLEKLKDFKTAGDPFTEEFFKIFESVHKQQLLMLKKLALRQKQLSKKIKRLKTWKKVSYIIIGAALVTFVICSVVTAVVAAPLVAAALATANSIPFGPTVKWFESLWNNYENVLKGQKVVASTMQAGTYIVIKDLYNIQVLFDTLRKEMESLLQTADSALKQDEAMKFAMEDIKEKLGVFTQSIEDLSEYADMFSRDIRKARTMVLQKIMKLPT